MPRLVLASRSPRRSKLLSDAGISFTVRPTIEAEARWNKGEAPVAYARRAALAKGTNAAAELSDVLVLAADTTVWTHQNAEPLGKPQNRDDARRMINLLTRGREHFVTTAYALIDKTEGADPKAEPTVDHETTTVWMRRLSADQIEEYLDHGDWSDKAGGYGIQGDAAGIVLRIEGSYTNVVGLPLAQVLERLEEAEQA